MNADWKFTEKLVRTREQMAKSELLSSISSIVVKNPGSEDARLPARRAYSSERRTPISVVVVTPGRDELFGLNVQFHHVTILQDIVALHHLAIKNTFAPDLDDF